MEVSFAESVEQYGLGGFLLLLLLSGALVAFSNSWIGLSEARFRKEKGAHLWLRPILSTVLMVTLLVTAFNMVNSKRDHLREAARS